MWPFKSKKPEAVNDHRRYDDDNLTILPQEKNFDWAHYQAITHGGIHVSYQDEYDFIPTIRVLKSLYCREPWVAFTTNAISRQFMNTHFELVLKTSADGDEQIITQHPALTFLSTVGRENPAFFTSNNIIDLILTGNAYVWISKNLEDKKRIPAERVDLKFEKGSLISYQITNPELDVGIGGSSLSLSPDEVVHFMLPNPYTPYVGMSLFMAINLPVLIDKYGREFIIGFFLRGGHTSGIIQTDATNADQLTRLVKSIMQAIGGRRNAHADKVLPKGAVWAGQGASFQDMLLTDILKDNQTLFRAATGTTNTILGIADGVNRATAMAEMEHFWKMTILPLQYIYCAAIKHSFLWNRFGLDDRYILRFDNSHVEYLDDFSRKLEEDSKLKPIYSINERRARLGVDPIERLGDKFEVEMTPVNNSPFTFSIPAQSTETKDVVNSMPEMVRLKSEMPKMQSATDRVENHFQREFARWEDITIANLNNLDEAKKTIKKRYEKFASDFADMMMPSMMKVYDFHINRMTKTKSWKISKDENTEKDRMAKLEALKERGQRVLRGKVFKNESAAFVGYSETNMDRIYGGISERLERGENLDDVATYVRESFGEFYEGQAKTIVRTEFASSIAESGYQFGNDLATICTKMKKTWVSMDDDFTRKDHLYLDGKEIVGESIEVPDIYFEVGGKEYLRYPKDETGEPDQVINCRCDIIWDVVEWES